VTGMKVIKRDGREVDFDRNKIISAIVQAVEKLCGFSIIVPLITVPFWSISSRLHKQQL
jgi:hypothetical protein